MAKLNQIPGMRVEEWLWNAIQDHADSQFCKVPDAVRDLIERGLAAKGDDTDPRPRVQSPADLQRERKQRLENETLEAKLAIMRKEWGEVAAFRQVWQKVFALMKSILHQTGQSIPNLTEEQRADLVKYHDDMIEQLRGLKPDDWEHGSDA